MGGGAPDAEASVLLDPAGLERLHAWGGDTLVGRMIGLFRDYGGEKVGEMERAMGRGDLEATGRAAHSLKSSAGNLGAERVRHLAAELEAAAGAGESDRAAGLAAAVRRSYDETMRALAQRGTGTSGGPAGPPADGDT